VKSRPFVCGVRFVCTWAPSSGAADPSDAARRLVFAAFERALALDPALTMATEELTRLRPAR
jgi:hypothetical protein